MSSGSTSRFACWLRGSGQGSIEIGLGTGAELTDALLDARFDRHAQEIGKLIFGRFGLNETPLFSEHAREIGNLDGAVVAWNCGPWFAVKQSEYAAMKEIGDHRARTGHQPCELERTGGDPLLVGEIVRIADAYELDSGSL
jgi:hypothetical protein